MFDVNYPASSILRYKTIHNEYGVVHGNGRYVQVLGMWYASSIYAYMCISMIAYVYPYSYYYISNTIIATITIIAAIIATSVITILITMEYSSMYVPTVLWPPQKGTSSVPLPPPRGVRHTPPPCGFHPHPC